MSAKLQGWIRGGGLLFSIGLAVIASLAAARFAAASPITTPRGDVLVTVRGENPATQVGRTVEYRVPVNPDNTFELKGQSSPGEGWSLSNLDVSGNVDPFTSLNFAVTNNAAVTLSFTVSVTLPIAPQGPSTLHGGSTGGTLTDANFNSVATVATMAGIPFYSGQIDGVGVLSIYPDVYSQSVAFAGQSLAVPALNPGLPGPTLASGAALATIGIVNRFTLTAGDIFSGNSFFVVATVPEPATAGLCGIALSLAILAGRRTRGL
jgi:hypothetical protein